MLAFPFIPTGHKNNQESIPNRSISYSCCTHMSISSVSQSCINITILLPSHPLPSIYNFLKWVKLPTSSNFPVFLIPAASFQSACPSLYIYASNCFSTYASLKEKLKIQRLSPHKTLLSQLTNSSLFILIKPACKSTIGDQRNWKFAAIINLLKCLLEEWHALLTLLCS